MMLTRKDQNENNSIKFDEHYTFYPIKSLQKVVKIFY